MSRRAIYILIQAMWEQEMAPAAIYISYHLKRYRQLFIKNYVFTGSVYIITLNPILLKENSLKDVRPHILSSFTQ